MSILEARQVEDPRQWWNARYATDSFLFGEEPSQFLQANAFRLRADQSALCVAAGEGRNSTWLAAQGLIVTAFDFSSHALVKADSLAQRRGARVELHTRELRDWPWAKFQFDVVIGIFVEYESRAEQDDVITGMRNAVLPGGQILLEGYRPEQIQFGPTGPHYRYQTYTKQWLQEKFADWKICVLQSYTAELHEGPGRQGKSALIDLIARKPLAAAKIRQA